MTTLFSVRIRDFGSERSTTLYFRSKFEAEVYSNSRDFADNPVRVVLNDCVAQEALFLTSMYFVDEY